VEKNINYTTDFKIGDIVMYLPNGLLFRCENNKMWKWMQESGNYVKIISDEHKIASGETQRRDSK
jgi:endo-1,4-beta-mannosidase